MAESTLEEARRCPSCGEPGPLKRSQPQSDRSKVDAYVCDNVRCRDYGLGWLVQVLPDGSIPKRGPRGPKSFPRFTASQEAMARRQIEEAHRADPSLPKPNGGS